MEDDRIVELENRIKLLESEKGDLKSKLDEVYKTINGRVNSEVTRKREEIIYNAQFELHQYYRHYMDDNMKLKKEISTLKKYIETMEKCNLEAESLVNTNMEGILLHSTSALHSKCNLVAKDSDILVNNRVKADKINLRNYNKNYDTKVMIELYNNGFTFDEVAKEIGCSVRTVKHRFEIECVKIGYKKYEMKDIAV